MLESSFDELKRYVGFGEADAANVRSLATYVEPAIPAIVDRFYDQIALHEEANAVLRGGDGQLVRLRETLLTWLREVFGGVYDEAYYGKRRRIEISFAAPLSACETKIVSRVRRLRRRWFPTELFHRFGDLPRVKALEAVLPIDPLDAGVFPTLGKDGSMGHAPRLVDPRVRRAVEPQHRTVHGAGEV